VEVDLVDFSGRLQRAPNRYGGFCKRDHSRHHDVALFGLVYRDWYAALMWALDDHAHGPLLIGNAALLLPPLAPLIVILRRRHQWTGARAVFWGADRMWPALWLIGQSGWAIDEVVRASPLPWFTWHIVVQCAASALPSSRSVAWPHHTARRPKRGPLRRSIIAVLVCSRASLYWSLVVARGWSPRRRRSRCASSRSSGRWSAWRPSRVWPGGFRCGEEPVGESTSAWALA